jgi:peptidyl-prolyl cis-trans isomerase B (cyclophilin B)
MEFSTPIFSGKNKPRFLKKMKYFVTQINRHPKITGYMKAEIELKHGTLGIELFDKDSPNTVENFATLAKKGFYNGLIFHRVIPDFMVQGGCPDGTGAGGPGYTIDCELEGDKQYHDRGVLSMAHAGRNTGGSQFFICHNRKNTAHLDGNHTVFGKVVENVDLIDQIKPKDKMIEVRILDDEA